jgi:hypothetical protein
MEGKMSIVYLETSVVSLIASRPSSDLITASMQKDSHDWWDKEAKRHRVVISQIVMNEINKGDKQAVEERMKVVQDLELLDIDEEVKTITAVYEKELGLPVRARVDILHMSISVVHQVDYLLTWNCTHIASPFYMQKLLRLNDKIGKKTPLFLTPRQYFEMGKERHK